MITLISGIPIIYIVKLILDEKEDRTQINKLYFLITLRFILDCFDGSLARVCGKGSKFGQYFDSFMDIVFIWSILIALAYKYRPPIYFYFLFLLSILQLRLYSVWKGSTVFFRPIFYILIILIAGQITKYKFREGKKENNE
jgi:phosphatidylglycerophosphate synthase